MEQQQVEQISGKERYSVLVELWIHQNSTQFQWPSVILAAVLVIVTLLVDKVSVESLSKTDCWGKDPKVRYGAGMPLLLTGMGTLIMVYIMRRHRKVLANLEKELKGLDKSFYGLVHPDGKSGSKLLQGFLAIIALASLGLGALFFAGKGWWCLVLILETAVVIWFYKMENMKKSESDSRTKGSTPRNSENVA